MSTPPRRKFFSRLLPPRTGTQPSDRRPGEFVRTLPVVALLTVLIWVYAERAQTREETLTVQFNLKATDPNMAVSVNDASDSKLAITVNGPRGQIEKLRNRLTDAPLGGRIDVPLSPGESTTGEKNVDLVARLSEMPLFSNSGISVTKTSPVQVRATVDPIVTRKVNVVLPAELPVTLQSYTLAPQQIVVTGPATEINKTFSSENATISVDVGSLRGIEAAGEQRRELPLQAPRDSRLVFTPGRVQMTFEVGSTITTDTVRTVAILVERPLGDEGKTKVVMRRGPVINNVKIRGPANLVAKYVGDQPEASLKAVLTVTQADVGRGEISRQVAFPYKDAGISVQNEPIEVTFEVQDLTP